MKEEGNKYQTIKRQETWKKNIAKRIQSNKINHGIREHTPSKQPSSKQFTFL